MSVFSLAQFTDKYDLVEMQLDEDRKQVSWRLDFNICGGMPDEFYKAFNLKQETEEGSSYDTVHWINFYVVARVVEDKLEITADYTLMYTGGREEIKDYEVSIDERLALAGKMEEEICGSVFKFLMGEL